MKTIVIYGRRTPCWVALNYLMTKKNVFIKVVSDDENVLWLAEKLGSDIRPIQAYGFFDLLICIHGTHIFTREELKQGVCVNIHPALEKYRGTNPIKRYIENKDIDGSVSAHFMSEIIDEGEIIHTEYFETPICNSHADFYNCSYIHYLKTIDKVLEKVL